jgi:hypothetical protein
MATIPVAGTIGQRIDLLIKQGSDFIGELECYDDQVPPQPTPLAGFTFRGHLRKKPGGTPLRTLVMTVFASHKIRISLTDDETATLKCGEFLDDDASQYVWDAESIETATGTILPAFYGEAQVYRDIGA